ncbi:hypothetical protein RB653_007112 [Dictyostelium firmibasis]|uniref:Uncharacterized protein n=1 Tax=Dictyostelium firmibasis TaxID=79012 RepID=A0AAN7YQY0_9MYCE
MNKLKLKLLLLLVVVVVNGQNYDFGFVDPSATCTSYFGNPLCQNRLSDSENVYTTGENKFSQISSMPLIEKAFSSLTFSQGLCKDLKFIEFGICDAGLSSCIVTTPDITPGFNLSLSRRVCKSVCERMIIGCKELSAQINCEQSFLFPSKGTTYNLTEYGYKDNNGLYTVPCIDTEIFYNKVESTVEFIEVCPFPLLLKNSSDPKYDEKKGYTYLTPTNCVLPCPLPNYTEKQKYNVITMSKVTSSISFVLSLYNCITFGILIKKKSKYNICIALMTFGSCCIYLSDVINYGIGIEKQLCPEPGRTATQIEDPLCGFTGSIFHIGISLCVFWAMGMGIVLYSKIKIIKLPNFRYFLIGNLSFTIITLIILASAKQFKGGNGFLECWMRDRWYVISIFWIPCGIATLIGILSICGVIYEIYKISKNVSLKDSKVVVRELKPFLLVVTVSGSLIYLFTFYFESEAKYETYKDGVQDYILCILTSVDPEGECFTVGPSFNDYFMFYFLIRFFGVLFFLIFGTSEIARKSWTESFFVTQIKSKISFTTFSSSRGGSGSGGDSSGVKSSSSVNSIKKIYDDDLNSKSEVVNNNNNNNNYNDNDINNNNNNNNNNIRNNNNIDDDSSDDDDDENMDIELKSTDI